MATNNSSDHESKREKEMNSSDENEKDNSCDHDQETMIKKTNKKTKNLEEDDTEENLQQINNQNPPESIVSKIPNSVAVKFSSCVHKQLTESDVNGGQSRLMLGKQEVKDKFLCLLEASEIPGKEAVDVLVYGPDGESHEMKFKMWIGNTPVLTNGWSKFVRDYELQKYSNVVKIWMFKRSEDAKICFVIDSIKFDDTEETLQVLLQQHNNVNREPESPPKRIFDGIKDMVGQFSRCIYKQLTESDVNGKQCSLMLGKEEVYEYFFCLLAASEIPAREGVDVLVYGPDGESHEMKFKMWNKNTPVLANGWSQFVEDYELQKYSDVVKIWMFRPSEPLKFCLAIDSTRFPIKKQLSQRIFQNVFKS